jgi:hypothetical protein
MNIQNARYLNMGTSWLKNYLKMKVSSVNIPENDIHHDIVSKKMETMYVLQSCNHAFFICMLPT